MSAVERDFYIASSGDEYGQIFLMYVEKKWKWLNPLRKLLGMTTHELFKILTKEELQNLDGKPVERDKRLSEPVEPLCLGSFKVMMTASDDWTVPKQDKKKVTKEEFIADRKEMLKKDFRMGSPRR